MRPSTCALRSIPPAVRELTIRCTLVRASRSVGDCVPLILASYQRPPCSPPVRVWFGAISPKRPFSPFEPVAPRTLLLDGPDWALVVKQFGKRFGWAPWVTTAPHPRPWSRADSAPPLCFSAVSSDRPAQCSGFTLAGAFTRSLPCLTHNTLLPDGLSAPIRVYPGLGPSAAGPLLPIYRCYQPGRLSALATGPPSRLQFPGHIQSLRLGLN